MKRTRIEWLGLLGVISLISYAAAVIFAPLGYPGYDWMRQAVSDLSAENSPSRVLWNRIAALYGTCGIVSITAVCIYIKDRLNKPLRVGIYLFAVMNWISDIGYRMFPLSESGNAGKFQDVMHIYVVTALVVALSIISLIVIMIGGFRDKNYRSIAVWALVAFLMMFVGSVGSNAVPKAYFGVMERISLFAAVGFNAVLGVYLFNGLKRKNKNDEKDPWGRKIIPHGSLQLVKNKKYIFMCHILFARINCIYGSILKRKVRIFMNDEKLIALMESSPDEARTALVEKYRNYVYAVVLSKLSGDASPDVIEDCVNDTFIEIFKSLPAYRGKGSLKAFIGTIASRTSLYKFRQQIRHKNSAVSIDDEDVPMIISDEDTESTVQDNAFRKRLWEIVDMLGEPDSRIIVYQYGYEFKIAEIAAMLSMTPAAVEKRSLRARKRIRKILENEKLI